MELIAASRWIAKAQAKVAASKPYADGITKVIAAVSSQSSIVHPLTSGRPERKAAAVLVISSDRGLAGAYSTNAIKAAENLTVKLQAEGKQVFTYAIGRKAVGHWRFRQRPLEGAYTGFSEQPTYLNAKTSADALIAAYLLGSAGAAELGGAKVGVDEIHVVFTEFVNAGTRETKTAQILPLDVSELGLSTSDDASALYEFEPDAAAVLDALLPRYVESRIYAFLLDSAASESSARRAAMKSASDNADELIKALTRSANQARQAVITQEIAEIVGGANALANG